MFAPQKLFYSSGSSLRGPRAFPTTPKQVELHTDRWQEGLGRVLSPGLPIPSPLLMAVEAL